MANYTPSYFTQESIGSDDRTISELIEKTFFVNLSPTVILSKRAFDIIFSLTVIILLLSWIVPMISFLIFIDSKGTIFYTQNRTGLYGRKFKIIKFRSMLSNADELDMQHSQGKTDPRITRVGQYLRMTRFDELPQFFNVLLGDMSVVGPRPLADYDSELLLDIIPKKYLRSLSIRPGITSIGQIRMGYVDNRNEMVLRLRYDLVYLRKLSFWGDIKIILSTVLVMFKGHGK